MYHQNTLQIFSPQYLGMFAVYELWVIAVVWVMKCFSVQTNLVDSKTYEI